MAESWWQKNGAAVSNLVSAGAGLTSVVGTMIMNKKTRRENAKENQRAREWAYDQEMRQRDFATSDWEREAAYNSPVEQMNRLRQAGLNPNLIYGKGADNTVGSIARSAAPSPHALPANKFDMSALDNGIMTYATLRRAGLESDLLGEQIANARAQRLYTLAQVASIGQKTQQQKELWPKILTKANLLNEQIGVSMDKTVADTNVAWARHDQIINDVNLSIQKNAREELANTANVALTYAKLLNEQLEAKEREWRLSSNAERREKLQEEIEVLRATRRRIQEDSDRINENAKYMRNVNGTYDVDRLLKWLGSGAQIIKK